MDAELEAERARGEGKVSRPTSRSYRYHKVALESARIIHGSTNVFITNPRDISDRSLVTQDTEWVNNLARYMQEFEYQKHKKQPKKKS